VFDQNRQLQETGGFMLQWAADNYVAASAIAFRRELDTQRGTENLYHLLCEMRDRPEVVCRSRFRQTWSGRLELYTADQAFEEFPLERHPTDRELDRFSREQVVADLATLAAQDKVLEYIQRTFAHRVPQNPRGDVPTFAEFHRAVEAVRNVFHRYYTLITHRTIANFEPEPQYDVYEAFTFPWIDTSTFDAQRCE
jgi:hypothetical protein